MTSLVYFFALRIFFRTAHRERSKHISVGTSTNATGTNIKGITYLDYETDTVPINHPFTVANCVRHEANLFIQY